MEHYYTKQTNTISNEKTIKVKLGDRDFKFITDNGVFSKKGLDFGTRSLLTNLPEMTGEILDFGCGYGPIGIYLKTKYQVEVTMLDINQRAINLAKKNCELNQVKCKIILSDMYENITQKYDYIITNPPIRIGKQKLYQILFEAQNYLKPNGELWLVINKNQGAKSLAKDLEKNYKVKIIDKSKGFYIILAQNC